MEAARANAHRLGLEQRVRFAPGSIPPEEDFELILANLPYVAEREWPGLQPEVREWEPREALLAGADGLDAIRALIPQVEVGVLALEVGEGQAEAVRGLQAIYFEANYDKVVGGLTTLTASERAANQAQARSPTQAAERATKGARGS